MMPLLNLFVGGMCLGSGINYLIAGKRAGAWTNILSALLNLIIFAIYFAWPQS